MSRERRTWKEPFGWKEREFLSPLDPVRRVGRELGGMPALWGTLQQASEKPVTETACVQALSLDLQCILLMQQPGLSWAMVTRGSVCVQA